MPKEYIYVNGRRIARVGTGGVYWYLDDMLGSSSVVAKSDGTIDSESDFYPFGGERVVTASSTAEHFKFTGKERDTETGNDYFGALYYSSSLGRFLSPDWAAKVEPIPYAKLGNTQSLNLYAYVQGNVESSTDADGHLKTPEDLWAGDHWGSSGGAMLTAALSSAMMEAMDQDQIASQATNRKSTSTETAPRPTYRKEISRH